MPRASKRRLDQKTVLELEERFFSILSSHNNKGTVKTFMKALLTHEEQTMLVKRIAMYSMLEYGKSTEDITFALKLSRETVRNHKYRYENMGEVFRSSIKKFIETRMRNEFLKNIGKSVISTFTVSDMMKRKMSLDNPPYER